MRIEPHDYHALRLRQTPSIAEGGRPARRKPDRRPSAACRASQPPPAAAAGDRARTRWGWRVRGAAPLPRPEPDHLQVAVSPTPPRTPRPMVGRYLPVERRLLPLFGIVNGKTVVQTAAAPRRRAARCPEPSRRPAEYDTSRSASAAGSAWRRPRRCTCWRSTRHTNRGRGRPARGAAAHERSVRGAGPAPRRCPRERRQAPLPLRAARGSVAGDPRAGRHARLEFELRDPASRRRPRPGRRASWDGDLVVGHGYDPA